MYYHCGGDARLCPQSSRLGPEHWSGRAAGRASWQLASLASLASTAICRSLGSMVRARLVNGLMECLEQLCIARVGPTGKQRHASKLEL